VSSESNAFWVVAVLRSHAASYVIKIAQVAESVESVKTLHLIYVSFNFLYLEPCASPPTEDNETT
jgi:hypothetical protein